jgi:hypothetical protein
MSQLKFTATKQARIGAVGQSVEWGRNPRLLSQLGQWAFVAGPGGTSDQIGFGQFNPSVFATVTGQAAILAVDRGRQTCNALEKWVGRVADPGA